MNTEHVWLYDCELSCTHCGKSPTLDTMCAVIAIDVVRGFLLMHRHCKKPLEPSKQVELFDAHEKTDPNHTGAIQGRASDMLRELREDDNTCELCGVVADDIAEHRCSGISAATDEPDPETDPPGHPDQLRSYLDDEVPEHDKPELLDSDDAFGKVFGHAKDHEQLRADLACVLQNKGGAPTKQSLIEALGAVGSVHFDAAAHWTRMQLAEMNRSEYPEFEPYLPKTPQPMPRALQAAFKVPKAKRAPRKKGAAPEDTSAQAMVTAEANAYLESVRAEP